MSCGLRPCLVCWSFSWFDGLAVCRRHLLILLGAGACAEQVEVEDLQAEDVEVRPEA